jgi:hypothetical protein
MEKGERHGQSGGHARRIVDPPDRTRQLAGHQAGDEEQGRGGGRQRRPEQAQTERDGDASGAPRPHPGGAFHRALTLERPNSRPATVAGLSVMKARAAARGMRRRCDRRDGRSRLGSRCCHRDRRRRRRRWVISPIGKGQAGSSLRKVGAEARRQGKCRQRENDVRRHPAARCRRDGDAPGKRRASSATITRKPSTAGGGPRGEF